MRRVFIAAKELNTGKGKTIPTFNFKSDAPMRTIEKIITRN
jgi:hypothetical protein